MRLSEKYPEFNSVLKGGIPHKQLFELLYTVSLCRYVARKQLSLDFPRISSLRKFDILRNAGYLKETDGIYTTTDKTLNLLKNEGYNTDIIIDRPAQGKGLAHSFKCTSVILQERKAPFFYAVIRPYFKYLVPDFAIVYKNDDKAKLVFFEIEESDKPESYLEDKKAKYEQLGRDPLAYRAWKNWAEKLGLGVCKEEEFCFSWRVI